MHLEKPVKNPGSLLGRPLASSGEVVIPSFEVGIFIKELDPSGVPQTL